MSMPAMITEDALYRTSEFYGTAAGGTRVAGGQAVIPQQICTGCIGPCIFGHCLRCCYSPPFSVSCSITSC
jgi:hypothetical protein